MDSITQMEKDKERLCLEIKYIKFYVQFRTIFVKEFPSDYFWLYFVFSNTKNLTTDKIDGRGVEYLVVSDLKKFDSEYEKNHDNAKWLAQLADKEKSIDTAESLFIKLAHHWCFIDDLFPAAKEYSVEQVLELILTFVKGYTEFGPIDDIIVMTSFTAFMKNNILNNKKPAVQA